MGAATTVQRPAGALYSDQAIDGEATDAGIGDDDGARDARCDDQRAGPDLSGPPINVIVSLVTGTGMDTLVRSLGLECFE